MANDGVDSYADRVEKALSHWISSQKLASAGGSQLLYSAGDDFLALAMLLGCPLMGGLNSLSILVKKALAGEKLAQESLAPPVEPSAEEEALIVNAWRVIIATHEPDSGLAFEIENHIVSGLLHQSRWKKAIETEDGACAFAALLVDHMARQRKPAVQRDIDMYQQLKPGVQSMISEWLAPVIFTKESTVLDFISALFGDAWVMFALDGVTTNAEAAEIIRSARPPMLVGRFSPPIDVVHMNLPGLEHRE